MSKTKSPLKQQPSNIDDEKATIDTSMNYVENNPIYNKIILTTTIYLKPGDLNHNLDDILHQRLCSKVEGICIKQGYIRIGSARILSRSSGKMNIGMFNGNISFIIKYEVDICNPTIGDIIECSVSDSNKVAVNAYVENAETSPLNIFLARQHHVGNVKFFSLKEGDVIKIKIMGKSYSFRDTNILVFGQFLGIVKS